jgi:hypothetical protein
MRREIVEYNGVRYYRYPDAKRPSDRRYFKRQGRYLHRAMWEDANGSIPDGFEVHHKDRDTGHNQLDNFELLDHVAHGETRRGECSIEQRAHLDRVRPKASEWHGSESGLAWHREHGKQTWESRSPRDRFCSQACKATWRRESGVDDIQVVCPECGQVFTKNRYARKRTCSRICGARARKRAVGASNGPTSTLGRSLG